MKTRALLLMVAFLLGMGVNNVKAAVGDTFTQNYMTFKVTQESGSNNTVSVTSYDAAGGTDVVIPGEVRNEGVTYKVTNIGTNAFENKGLTAVALPTTLRTIDNSAFSNNPMTEVVIPNNVTIQFAGFGRCPNLTKVTWFLADDTNLALSASQGCFYNSTNLKDIYLVGEKWGSISNWPTSDATAVTYHVNYSVSSLPDNVSSNGTLTKSSVSIPHAYTIYVGTSTPITLSGADDMSWFPQDDAANISQYIDVESGDETIVYVDNTARELIFKNYGTTTVTAKYHGVTLTKGSWKVWTNRTSAVSFSPSEKTLKIGETYTPTPTITAENGTIVYWEGEWTSSNTDIATVSSTGEITAVSSGTATITFKVTNPPGNKSGTLTVKVADPDISNLTLNGGETTFAVNLDKTTSMTFTPAFDCEGDKGKVQLDWTSDDTSIASFGSATTTGEADNTLTPKSKVGTANIECSHTNYDGTKVAATATVNTFRPTVTGLAFSQDVYQVVKGTTVDIPITFNADVAKEDVKISYTASNSSYVTLQGGTSLMGETTNSVKGVSNTTTTTVTITASHTNNDGTVVRATAKVIVAASFAESITLSPSSQMMSPGETATLTPKVTGYSGSTSYTWTSSNTSVATVSNGTVTAKGYGSALITCRLYSTGQEATCKVTVRNPDLVNVGNFFYRKLSDGTLEVTNCIGGKPSNLTDDCYGYSGTVTIPATVSYEGTTYDVSTIGEYAFYNQVDLQGLIIPASVKVIDESACEGAKNLGSVSFQSKKDLLRINDRAFYGCKKLKRMLMPNSTLGVYKSAFQGCDALADLSLSSSLTHIDDYAFADCPVLTDVELPETNLNITVGAFQNDIALTEITFPAGLQGLGASAFQGCKNLKEVTFNTTIDQPFTVGEDAFAGTSVERVKIANLDSWISTNFSNPAANPASISHHIYQGDTEIIDAIVPEGPLAMNNNVFYGCSSLKTLQLPSTLEIVNDNTLYGCTALEKVYVRAAYVPEFLGTGDPSLMNDVFSKAELYVPTGKQNKYSNDEWWGRFTSITANLTDAQCATPTIDYSGGKLVFSCATEGVNYVYSVKIADAKDGSGNNVNVSTVYTVSVYATKAGMANSDTATVNITVGGSGGIKGDINGDNEITAQDASLILQYIAGKISW